MIKGTENTNDTKVIMKESPLSFIDVQIFFPPDTSLHSQTRRHHQPCLFANTTILHLAIFSFNRMMFPQLLNYVKLSLLEARVRMSSAWRNFLHMTEGPTPDFWRSFKRESITRRWLNQSLSHAPADRKAGAMCCACAYNDTHHRAPRGNFFFYLLYSQHNYSFPSTIFTSSHLRFEASLSDKGVSTQHSITGRWSTKVRGNSQLYLLALWWGTRIATPCLRGKSWYWYHWMTQKVGSAAGSRSSKIKFWKRSELRCRSWIMWMIVSYM